MKTIKIGRNVYEIKKGDYILDNGACLQLCSGDRRPLRVVGWSNYTSIKTSESTLKKQGIILKDLPKQEQGSKEEKTFSCKYFL